MENARGMDGKICLVTGANRGIGEAVASELSRLGAQVILAGRSEERLHAARRAIQKRWRGEVESICLDLASKASIRHGASRIQERFDRLDVLVNNAATIPHVFEQTSEGIEMQFAVNHLGPFLLTQLLLPLLRIAPSARIVNVASNAHFRGLLDLTDGIGPGMNPFGGGPYHKQRCYKATKLANVLFTYALARRLQGTRVQVNAVRPGTINTHLVGDFLQPFGFLRWIFVLSTPSHGAAPIVRLASDPALEGVTGRYFDRFRERRSSVASYDETLQERLWEQSHLWADSASPEWSAEA